MFVLYVEYSKPKSCNVPLTIDVNTSSDTRTRNALSRCQNTHNILFTLLCVIVTAHAMIIGSQHFVTFDQRHYDFKGHCSYLLANDFIGHEFSLVLSYEPEIKGHYTMLLILGSETISIDLQRKVSARPPFDY